MSDYNNFGVNWFDIVNFFNQSTEDDFASSSVDGRTNIEKELSINEGKLLAQLSESTVKMLDRLSGVRLHTEVVNVSGDEYITYAAFPTNLPPITGDGELYMYAAPLATNCENGNCTNTCDKEYPARQWNYNQLSVIGSYIIPDSYIYNNITGKITAVMSGNYSNGVYVEYNVDHNNSNGLTDSDGNSLNPFHIAEFAGWIRNRTCCIFGRKLLLENESKWSILDEVCKEEVFQKNFVPACLKKLNWWKKPWFEGIATGKINRG
jgi:hypothetical protein